MRNEVAIYGRGVFQPQQQPSPKTIVGPSFFQRNRSRRREEIKERGGGRRTEAARQGEAKAEAEAGDCELSKAPSSCDSRCRPIMSANDFILPLSLLFPPFAIQSAEHLGTPDIHDSHGPTTYLRYSHP